MEFPAQYMFKDVPEDIDPDADPVAVVLERDGPLRHRQGDDRRRLRAAAHPLRAVQEHPDRFFGSLQVDPNRGHGGRPRPRARPTRRSASRRPRLPGRLHPQVPINDKRFYPDLRQVHRARHPDLLHRRRARAAGADGSARRSSCIDEVCWFFPELKFVMRHGAEPWDRRWP